MGVHCHRCCFRFDRPTHGGLCVGSDTCVGWVDDVESERGLMMMDLRYENREVRVTLRDDVWQLEEPGTICFTRDQAIYLRAHLNSLMDAYADYFEPEDG